jgi:hypothetical protein
MTCSLSAIVTIDAIMMISSPATHFLILVLGFKGAFAGSVFTSVPYFATFRICWSLIFLSWPRRVACVVIIIRPVLAAVFTLLDILDCVISELISLTSVPINFIG